MAERLRGETAAFDIVAKGKVLVEEGKRITARHIKLIVEAGLKSLSVPEDYLVGRIVSQKR